MLKTREVDDVMVVDVSGRITLGQGTSAIRGVLRGLVADGKKKILLNLSKVRNIDSAGIAELVSGYARVADGGGSLKLLGLTSRMKEKVLGARAM